MATWFSQECFLSTVGEIWVLQRAILAMTSLTLSKNHSTIKASINY
jgi:hypothetical protein